MAKPDTPKSGTSSSSAHSLEKRVALLETLARANGWSFPDDGKKKAKDEPEPEAAE